MPFYEYQCKQCGHHLEAMQKVNDAPLKRCPACGKSTLVRLMSAPVFRLKGGGWYETDFKSDQEGKRNLADRPDADAKKPEADSADKGAKAPAAAEGAGAKDKPAEKAADKPAAKPGEAAPAKRSAAAKPPRRAAAAKRPVKKAARRTSGRR